MIRQIMATYERFEDLPVWQAAAKLYDKTEDFLAHAPARLRPSFRDQLERAALSVSNNIAEGFDGVRQHGDGQRLRVGPKQS